MKKRFIKGVIGCGMLVGVMAMVGCQSGSQTPTTQYEVEASQEGSDITIDWDQFATGGQSGGEKKTTASSKETTTKKGQKETTTKKGQKETTTKKQEETTTKKGQKETTTKKQEETTTKKGQKETTTKKQEETTTRKGQQVTTTKKQEETTTKKNQPTTTTKKQEVTTTEEYTTEEIVVLDHYETVTDANHEGGMYAVYSNGTKEKISDIKWRKDLAQQVFSKIAPLRKANAADYALTTAASQTAVWNDEVYKICQSTILELVKSYDTQKQISGYRVNVYKKNNATGWSDAKRMEFVWNTWTNVDDDEGKWDMYDLMKGGMTSSGVIAEAIACYQYGDTEYWIYLARD